MNTTPNVLRAFAQAFQLVADALDQPQAQADLSLALQEARAGIADQAKEIARLQTPPQTLSLASGWAANQLLNPTPVAEAPKAKPAPVANDDDDLPSMKVKPFANDDDDETPAPKAEVIKKPVASDDDEAPAPKVKPAPASVVDFAKLRAEAAALLVAYVDEHGMSLAAKVLRKHGADKVSKVADVSLQSLVDALKAGEPE